MAGALREVLARFGVAFDDTQLKKGDKAVDGVAAKLGQLGGLLAGGLIVSKLASMGKEMLDQADALAKQSSALGLSTTEMQEWQHAAILSGSSAEGFTDAFTKFNKNVADASRGTGPAADALRKLGISATDSAGNLSKPIELLDGVAEGLNKIESPARRTEVAMSLFGKSGAKLLPLFSQGAEGMKKLRAEVADLGGGFSPEFAKNAEDVNDSLTRLNLAWLSFKVRLGGLVLPLITRFVTAATKATAFVSKWTDKIGLLKSSANLAASAAAVLGAAFLVAGIKAIAPWIPMLALFAGLVLLGDELITMWQGGDTIIGRALDKAFGKGSSKKATEWVKSVVKSTKELFTDTERALNEFNDGLSLIWFDFSAWFAKIWIDMGTAGALALFDLENSATGVAASIQDAFATMWNAILDGAQKALEKANGVIDKIPGARALIGKLSISDDSRAATDNRANADRNAAAARSDILAKGDAKVAALATQRASIVDRSVPVVTDNSQVNITVPDGTPQQQVKAIVAAVKQAKGPSNKAKMNALVKTGG